MSSMFRTLILIVSAATLVIATTVVIVLWTAQAWPAPLRPALYHGGVLLLMFAAGAALWFVTTRKEIATAEAAVAEDRGYQGLIGLVGGVLAGLCALAITGAWAIPQVRAIYASTSDVQLQLELALQDRSPVVRLAACKRLFEQSLAFGAERELIAALDAHPEIAAQCLEAARDHGWIGDATIAAALRTGWDRTILTSDDEAVACELVAWSPKVEAIAGGAPNATLLDCSLRASDPAVRQCCATNLVGAGALVDAVGPATQFPAEYGAHLFAPMTIHAFFPSMLPEAMQATTLALRSTTPEAQDWTIALGCSLIDPQQAQTNVVRGFVTLLENGVCDDAGDIEALSSPSVLLRVCQHTTQSTEGTAAQRLCEGIDAARAEVAVDVARFEVYDAIRAMSNQRDAAQIERGLALASMFADKTDEELEWEVFLGQNAVDTLPVTSEMDATCRKVSTSGGRTTISTSMNCRRVSRHATVGQVIAEQEARQGFSAKGGEQSILDLAAGGWKNHPKLKAARRKADGRALKRAEQKYNEAAKQAGK